MKAKLLKKLRSKGRRQVHITSVARWGYGDMVLEVNVSYNDKAYEGLWCLGDTENDVLEKAARIYMDQNIDKIRSKYKKYSINFKQQIL